jgi:hypothetical protein
MCRLVCEGGLLILNLQRLFSHATRGPLENSPCQPDLSLSSPAIFIVCLPFGLCQHKKPQI